MEHTRKKIYAGLLSALLALSLLTGCGGGNQSGGDAGKSQPDADTPEVTDEQRDIDEREVTEEQFPDVLPPVIGLTTDSYTHYDDDLNALVNSMETELPGADADTHANWPKLAAALDRFRENAHDKALQSYQEREDTLPEFIELGGNGGDYGLYGETHSIIRRADAKAVSVVNVLSEYIGGTHVNYGYDAANFDAATGEEIALESLLTDEGAETLNARIGQELDALYPDLAPGGEVAEYAPEDYAFSIEPDGVTFWFYPGKIAGFAYGLLTVKLHFIRDNDILNDTYDNADSAWFVELGENAYRFTAANGSIENVEPWNMVNMAADSDDYFGADVFYARIPHGDYVVVILDMGEGNHDIFVYRSNGELVQRLERTSPETFFYPELPEEEGDIDWDDYDLYHSSLTNPDDTRLYTYSGLFGSWNAGGSYRLTDSGFQLQQELLYGNGFTLTFMQDFTVTRCDPDNWLNVTDEEITIPAGTEVNVVAVNPEQTAAYFRVPDAAQLTNDDKELIFPLSYDNGDEWPQTVNGIDENDLFDGLQYAG